MPNLVFPTCSILQILDKTQTEVFLHSGFLVKSLIKENCHNSKTSDDIDVKLGPETKIYKRNETTSKSLDDDVMSENYDVIVIFSVYGQFGAIRNPDSGGRVCNAKLMFSLIVIFYLTKTENRTKKSLTQVSQYWFE